MVAAVHQGRKCGYHSARSIRSNMLSTEYGTSTERLTSNRTSASWRGKRVYLREASPSDGPPRFTRSWRPAMHNAPRPHETAAGRGVATREDRPRQVEAGPSLADYSDERTIATTAFRSASLAATLAWSSVPPVLSKVTSFASAPALPLYFSATDAHDGAFLVVW